ncbi:hypothetical protein BDW42DRAFT_158846 [Aspergillus taichungensis]|uniref:Uncharacterized protein n=1 Tax=Aspergillus taichungensis TaxID=482145 RepID=A0A2J5I8A1_9EURO|nr:hypothetical protein BDW42DRAFT_158846 [Aspergillus taichungensis]
MSSDRRIRPTWLVGTPFDGAMLSDWYWGRPGDRHCPSFASLVFLLLSFFGLFHLEYGVYHYCLRLFFG